MTARPGRKMKEIDPRVELFEARKAARTVLDAWERIGGDAVVEQEPFSTRSRLSNGAAAKLNRLFPVVVTKTGKKNQWDLAALRSVLQWDDPVIMLRSLAVSDPASWRGALLEAEAKPCSKVQEDVIRMAFDAWRMSVTVIEDPLVIRDLPLFMQNSGKRLK